MQLNGGGYMISYMRNMACPQGTRYLRRKNEVTSAYRLVSKEVAATEGPRRSTPGAAKPSQRKRAHGGGRKHKSLELFVELWHWFVDRINNVKGRANSQSILAQVEVLKGDIRNFYHRLIEKGQASKEDIPELKKETSTKW